MRALLLLALALPAVAATGPNGVPITPDTACGARASGQILRPNGTLAHGGWVYTLKIDGKRVNAAGVWETCQMPASTRPCKVAKVAPNWGRNCQAAEVIGGRTIPHGESELAIALKNGKYAGYARYTCRDGAFTLSKAVCQ